MNTAIEKRYPQLAFLLSCHEKKKMNFEELELIYLMSVSRSERFFEFKAWLAKDAERDLVFIEEDLDEMERFLKRSESEEILAHPQVHIRYLFDKEKRDSFFREIADEFPYKRLELFGDDVLRLKMLRLHTVTNALYEEDLYYHLLSQNLLANIKRLPKAFSADKLAGAFEGVPAIICGAGPSLNDEMERLKGLEDKALILAGGSTITALTKAGVKPHICFAIDPNPLEYERLKESEYFEGPLIYGNRLQPRIFELFNGPFGYKHTKTGGALEAYFEMELGIEGKTLDHAFGEEALSVTTSAIAQAVMMGCSPIYFVGIDLAFTGMQSYASGIVSDASVDLDQLKAKPRSEDQVVEKDGVITLVKWVMESEAIAKFAKAHKDVEWIHASSGGLGFEGIKRQPLEEVSFEKTLDLRGLVHAVVGQANLGIDAKLLNEKLLELKGSLIRIKEMLLDVIETPHLVPILELEMVEEVGYRILLRQLEMALLKMLKRKFREDEEKIQAARFRHLLVAIDKYIEAC
ncbi:MAG: hypothetical protein SP1CHLAM54_01500 [Chlamydiia bacterium]|nr:hypothetical protein [Chlamydiia bacterium]MCH9615069.1 hypothetical protein [Chlamydiia bacterium]MCH9628609.1 hypothetical protein [Chlamydiia bacterium]